VKESGDTAAKWAQSKNFTFPVLLDLDGKTAQRYAPAGVLPDLPRDQVPIASNLIIDRNGRIQFFSLLDSANFDARLIQLTKRLEELLASAPDLVPTSPTGKEVISAPAKKEVVSIIPPVLVTVLPGSKAQARIAVLIAPGFHIQANPASDSYLIPTKIDLQAARGVFAELPKYPPGKRYRLAGSSQDLSTYEGTIELSVPLRAAEDAVPGDWIVRGKLRYQACDSRSCLPPASLDVSVPVHVLAVKKKLPIFK
jgi:hypothetical protein